MQITVCMCVHHGAQLSYTAQNSSHCIGGGRGAYLHLAHYVSVTNILLAGTSAGKDENCHMDVWH